MYVIASAGNIVYVIILGCLLLLYIKNDCEVLLTMPQFTNTGADGYVQQQKDETPSLSTGTSSDQSYTGDSNSSSNTYSTATATTNYIPEITPSFSSSNAGGYIQSATSFPSVTTSLSADSGIEEFLVENLHMSDVSEAEDKKASTMVNTTMRNESTQVRCLTALWGEVCQALTS